ncbi:hypothetical protein TanjilG_11020 [Lupinus angustifolius]|uniref:Sieve element occlusion C-terminal domain-containing protein n=1 Tax=Lupinus angustifolius TaxID=3871 RepID=A0A1J7H570_LUPAN|nr:hypothetical protein TanjilG_11020 [Lupinus angustifolius]
MSLFDLIGNYRWDAKVVLVLAAFATKYGEFWNLTQLYPCDTLAASIMRLKKLPYKLRVLKPQIKALSLLVKTMMDVAMCIIKFEAMPLQHVELGNDVLIVTKFSDSTIIAAWELSSLAYRLSNIYSILKDQVDVCQQEIERNLHVKLLSLVDEMQNDNQKILNLLFASNNYLSLKDCPTQVKLGVSELKNKIVLLLISKPKLFSLEELLLLVQQTCDHHLSESYKIVWVPLPSSDTWTDSEDTSFNFLSDSLPWYAIWKPRSLRSAVVKYIREEWNYNEEPLMVVLDSNGKVTNNNALDMINIWGARSFPFSASKEAELWQDQNLTMQLLLSDINPLLAYWVKEGKNLCIYGSENLAWIKQFNDNITQLKKTGLQLETIYVGNSKLSEQHIKEIMATTTAKNLSVLLSFTKLQFFWLRLESMRRSKLRQGKTPSSDHVLEELSTLLEMNDKEQGWAVFGSGSLTNIMRLQGEKVMELLKKYHEWGENVPKLGLLGAIRNFLDPTFVAGPCSHFYLVPSSEEVITQGSVICEICMHPMKKFVVYQP